MKPIKQQFRHRPEEGIFGDCYRTAIACILGCNPLDLPHEHRKLGGEAFHKLYDGWLNDRGIERISVPFPGDGLSVEQALALPKHWNPHLPCIFSGTSRTGVNHSVVCWRDEIFCDPSLTDAGIIGPCNDGYYWVDWLVISATGRKPDRAPATVRRPGRSERQREAR